MRTRWGGADRESGQVTTALIVVVIVGLTAVGILGVFVLARGVDERSKAQTAADAAALAGADALGPVLPSVLAGLGTREDALGNLASSLAGCDLGRPAAEEYAAANDAEVTAYCFDLDTGEVTVEVAMTDPVSDDVGPAEATAVASSGLGLGSCGFEDEEVEPAPEPTPDPEPTPPPTAGPGDPAPEPTPPPDVPTTLQCGSLSVGFLIGGADGALGLDGDLDLDLPEPELVD